MKKYRIYSNIPYFLWIILTTAAVQTPCIALSSTDSSLLLSEILLLNLPSNTQYSIHEEVIFSNGEVYSKEFQFFAIDSFNTIALDFPKHKKILITNSGMDIWTLNEKNKKIRKKSIYQKKESLFNSNLTYWDFFPLAFKYKKFHLKDITPIDSLLKYSVEVEDECLYRYIDIFITKQDSSLIKIDYYQIKNKIRKSWEFSKTDTSNTHKINHFQLTDHLKKWKTTWTITQRKSISKLPAIFEKGKNLF